MKKLKIFILIILISLPLISYSQGEITHSLGIIAGPIQIRSDYGERKDSDTNFKNTGFGIALVDYMNLTQTDFAGDYFRNHFKIRNEFSYSKTNLQHYGEWVQKNTIPSEQLKAMRGSTQLFSLGFQLEYSFIEIPDYERKKGSFNPYVSIGPQINYYTATATSTLGELGDPAITFPKYLVPSDGHPYGFSNESKIAFSGTFNAGTIYNLNDNSDLVFDTRFQIFSSDWIDGLNPNKDLFKENKSNDWLFSIGIGYIYYLRH